MNLEEIMQRLAELDEEVRNASDVEFVEKAAEEKRGLLEKKAELESLEQRKADALAIQNKEVEATVVEQRKGEAIMPTVIEERAAKLIETGKMELETRQLLSSGVLTGTALKQTIGELPNVVCSIVDDVNAIMVDGIGSYAFAYQATDAAAAAVTEGSAIGGTAATFSTGSISPSTWGCLDTISKLVSKKSPLAYEQAIKNAAYIALRRKAKTQIVTTVLADTTMTTAKSYTLDHSFVRNLVLGFNADESVAGGTKLYLCKEDLATLGAVRGTNEKKAVFEITFVDENNGVIRDGGMAVNFSICSDLKGAGASNGNKMIYGQPQAIAMPLWGNYEVSTDEGGKYFEANLMAVRGIQTAGVGITKLHAIQIIN